MNFQKGMANAYNYIGNTYSVQGNYIEALAFFLKSLNLEEKLENKKGMAMIYNNIGNVYISQGDYPNALEYHLKSLEFKEKLDDKNGMANAFNAIGVIHYYQENYSKAIAYYSNSIKLNKELGNKMGIAFSYNVIGVAYDLQGKNSEAMDNYLSALRLYESLENKPGMAQGYVNIGIIYKKNGNYTEALNYYLKALTVQEELGRKPNVALIFNNLGILYFEIGDLKEAIIYSEKSIAVAQEIGSVEDLKTAYHNLSEVYSKEGEYEKAFNYYQRFSSMKDSLLDKEKHKQIAEMVAKYESETKEKEIELLSEKSKVQELRINNRNYIIYGLGGGLCLIIIIGLLFLRQNKLRAKQRTTELEQRALRTQMNPHFIFNSLNSIQKFFMESKHEKANEYLADFGNLMRKILENSSKQQITVANEISALKLYLSLEKARLDDMLNYEIKVDGGIDEYHILMPPLVIQPFVENAIWHGIVPKKAPGKVMVSLKTENNLLICTVEDDGIGIEKSKQLKQSGGKKHEPMGMKVTEERVEKVETEALEPGTRITIHIPIT